MGIILQTKVTASAPALRRWLVRAAESLGNHSDRLNAINIFPVADGDTGTNLYLTVRAAADAAAEGNGQDLGELLAGSGRSAMEDAYGNSGTLFAVFLAALAEPLHGAARLTAPLLAAGLERAEVRCWSALSEPVAGTMLSVLEAASRSSADAEPVLHGDESNVGLGTTLDVVIEAALKAVVRTEDQLGALKEAQVVDAGAVGLLLVLDALRASVMGTELRPDLLDGLHGYNVQDPHIHQGRQDEGVEVMCTVNLSPLDAASLRSQLDALGDSVIMSAVSEVPGGYRWRVHVHLPEAEPALEAIRSVGEPDHISVTALAGTGTGTEAHER
jgi:dihydroxyacetone kinase-like predicted kinase